MRSGEDVRLYGREPECAALDRLLEGARRSRSGALVLRAEAGVGKTALLGYARSRGADLRILQAVGVEPEIELPFAALYQLLRPVVPTSTGYRMSRRRRSGARSRSLRATPTTGSSSPWPC
jgi:hypothetical protein